VPCRALAVVIPACQTAPVTYHEAFWVATAAAAPVIALATVVAGPDADGVGVLAVDRRSALRMREWQKGKPAPDAILREAKRTTALIISAYLAFLLDLLIQAALLAVSLSALAAGQNVMPPWVAIVMAVAGILILAWAVSVTAAIRRQLEYLATRESANGQD
jgi:hypothetical protein